MIKLIASDLDGTILLNGAQSVDESLFDTIRQLLKIGIYFAPASGRQYASLRALFGPVAENLLYIAENGALVKYKNETLVKQPMDKKLALDIIEDVIKIPNCEVLVAGEDTAYFRPKSKEYEHRMTKVVKYNTTYVDDFRDIKEDILKVAVCDLSGIVNSKDYLLSKWGQMTSATVSGLLYIDYMAKNVNKGTALKKVMQNMSLAPSECMAFGDNFNDLEMLQAVEHSFVMENAADEVKIHGKHISSKVEDTIKNLILS